MNTKPKDKAHHFEVQLNWQQGSKGILTAADVKDLIRVATSPEFEGSTTGMWSAEHLFLSAVSSCFMAAYLNLAQKAGLQITHFESSITGKVERRAEHLEFTAVAIYPKIFVAAIADITAAQQVMEKAFQYCIVTNSIKPQLQHHGQILLEQHRLTNK